MLQRGATLVLRRCLSTATGLRRTKGLNLTPHGAAPSATLAQENEEALKQLNIFLELAAFGCNNDAFNARKQVLALTENRQAINEEPVRFPLAFHVPVDDFEAQEHVDGFVQVKYTVEVPGRLVKRTLSNLGRSVSAVRPEAALQTPFAREWQRTTKRILQDLFQVAQVPLVVEEEEETKTTALAAWLAEEETAAGIRVGEQNRAKKREHEQFDKIFHQMLTHEKNIVQETTTGLEDGPTTQHAVLTSLLHSRLFLPKFEDPHMKKSAFHWIANLLLVNFMELRLHSLVWNKITLLITADAEVEEPQVSWDEEHQSKAWESSFLLNVEDLEFALEAKTAQTEAAVKEQQRLRREKKKQKRKQKRQGHFYQDELNTIFRQR
ncbi:hypothetical protein GQ600_9633 [Phytophthora cactorum]|nr:hypothetical protein GQ600_9633 [Phytophthora cactorum]